MTIEIDPGDRPVQSSLGPAQMQPNPPPSAGPPRNQAAPAISSPRSYFLRMIIYLALLAAAIAALMAVNFETLWRAFNNNAVLNGAIIAIFLVGILYVLRQVNLLGVDVNWINNYARGGAGPRVGPPRLLASMARSVGGSAERSPVGARGRAGLTPTTVRLILDSVVSRQDEVREIARYLVGLLIFMGLLGTFWGLLGTVNAVADVIGQLDPRTGDLSVLFGDLTAGLRAPLDGMGTAFSTSLFGMAASLLLGFLDLQAGQAHSRFFNELEEWLHANTYQGTDLAHFSESDAGPNLPAYINALLIKSAESLDDVQHSLASHHEAQAQTGHAVHALTGQLAILIDQMRVEQELLMQLAKSGDGGAVDEISRGHIRNTDIHLARLVEELGTSRERLIAELREEIRLVSRTIAATMDDGGAQGRAQAEPHQPVQQAGRTR